MKKKLLLLYSWFVWSLTFFLPDIPFIMRLRGGFYSICMKGCGRNLQVSAGVKIYGLERLSIGSDVYIATNVVINAGADIEICNEVLIGIGSIIVSGNHTLLNGSYRFGKPKREKIFIGSGSWIAGNVTIAAGANIPDGTLIAANSFVSSVLDSSGIYGGCPARLIR
ncbi:TPA: acyltransferase, partial [Vibrio cholerae]|nr:acyltransferase [Vibrio cholerae]